MSHEAIFALIAAKNWEIDLIDVKTVFLYKLIKGEVYIQQPTSFDNQNGDVSKL